jgi:hypothetical protein
MSIYHPTRPDATPFHVPFTNGKTGQQFLLSEDNLGPKLLRRIGMTWLYSSRPSQEEVLEILAATGED